MNPTCGHRDHYEDGEDVDQEPAVGKYEGEAYPGGPSFEYWACEEHEPDVEPIERVEQ